MALWAQGKARHVQTDTNLHLAFRVPEFKDGPQSWEHKCVIVFRMISDICASNQVTFLECVCLFMISLYTAQDSSPLI